MPSPKRFLSFLVLAIMAWKETSAAPVPEQGRALQPFDRATGTLDTDTRPLRRRSLAGDLRPLLALLAPTLEGADAGLQQGAGNIKATVKDVGAALNQAAHGVGDIAADTVAGAGSTVGHAPAAVVHTVHDLDHSDGAIGSVDRTVFGN